MLKYLILDLIYDIKTWDLIFKSVFKFNIAGIQIICICLFKNRSLVISLFKKKILAGHAGTCLGRWRQDDQKAQGQSELYEILSAKTKQKIAIPFFSYTMFVLP